MPERISWILDARNQASGEFNNAEASLRKLEGTTQGVVTALAGFATVAGAIQLGRMAFDLAQTGAQTERLRTSFDNLAKGVGQSSDEMLAAMKRASGGAISNADLIQGANRAMLLGVADNAEEMAQLLDVAGARGKAMGRTMTEAFDDIVTGIGRMSPLILDNLGIVTGGAKVFDDYAASIGRSAASLTDAEKKQALFNSVIASSATLVAAQAAAGDDAAVKFEQAQAAIDNARVALGQLFSADVATAAENLAAALTSTVALLEYLRDRAETTGQSFGELEAAWANYDATVDRSSATLNTNAAAQMEVNRALARTQEQADGVEAQTANLTRANALASQSYRELYSVVNQTSGALSGLAATAQNAANSIAVSLAPVIGVQNALATAGATSEQIWSEANRIMVQTGATLDEFQGVILPSVIAKYQDLATQQTQTFTGGAAAVSEYERAAEQAFNNIASAAQGVIQGALDPGVGVDPDKILAGMGLSEDHINENARRLADIAQNGLKGQDWLGDFAKTAPDIWKQIRVAANPQEEAARLLKDFQAGLRLDGLIDRDKAKQLVKDMITGGQNIAQMAQEIAQEVADEMGISLQQAQQATQQALGGAGGGGMMAGIAADATTQATAMEGPGAAAASAFSGGFTAWFGTNAWGAKVVTTLAAELKKEANMTAVGDLGRLVGGTWGNGFLATVGENLPQALLDILVSKLGPLMQAQMQLNSQLTGAR